MFDNRLALMAGTDIPIPECQVTLHQPTMKEIALVGEKNFFTGIQCLCVQKEMCIEDKNLLSNTSNFQIFMTVMSEKQTADKKQDVISALTVLFPTHRILFTPRALVLNSDKGNSTIDENNFEILQQVIQQVFCIKTASQDFNPANDAAKKIADKLMRGRQRVAAQKAAENGDGSSFVQYLSILTIGLNSMSLQDCLNLTIYQLYDLVERYQLYVNWDIDLRSRLAGGKPDKPADNWMKVIH